MTRTRVLKFGGTSLGTPELLRAAALQVAAIRAVGERVAVVVSAMGHATDRLVTLAGAVAGAKPTPRELDVLLATGEQVSAALMAMALRTLGLDATSIVGARIGISTDARHGAGTIRRVEPHEVLECLERGAVPVIAGFQGIDPHGDLVTLGRGGSDTTAVAIAAAIRDHEAPGTLAPCEILTDVPGIFTADPRAVADATPIESISAKAMLQLARVGAQVMHPPAVALALAANVEIVVREAHPGASSGVGTRIVPSRDADHDPSAVGLLVDRTRLRLSGHSSPAGVIRDVREQLGRCHLASLADAASPGLVVAAGDAAEASELLRQRAGSATVIEEPDLTVVSLVGVRSDPSLAMRAGQSLARGWWDGDPPTAWWLLPAAEAIPLARQLLSMSGPFKPQGDSGQRNGDYETFGSGEGGAREAAAGSPATMIP